MKYVVVSVYVREVIYKNRGKAAPSIDEVRQKAFGKILEYGFEIGKGGDAEIISEHSDIPSANKVEAEWNAANEEMHRMEGSVNQYIYGITTAIVTDCPETDEEKEEYECNNVLLNEKNNLYHC